MPIKFIYFFFFDFRSFPFAWHTGVPESVFACEATEGDNRKFMAGKRTEIFAECSSASDDPIFVPLLHRSHAARWQWPILCCDALHIDNRQCDCPKQTTVAVGWTHLRMSYSLRLLKEVARCTVIRKHVICSMPPELAWSKHSLLTLRQIRCDTRRGQCLFVLICTRISRTLSSTQSWIINANCHQEHTSLVRRPNEWPHHSCVTDTI